MSDGDREREEEGGEEGPESLQTQHELTGGTIDLRGESWRRGIAQIDRVPFGGEGWWEPIGPEPLHVLGDQIFQGIGPNSGIVVDVAIDPTPDSRTIYIATSSGGVWKTVNGGQTWKPLTDLLPSMQIGAIAIDPGDPAILYVGTGTLFEGGGGIAKARGIFKSLDGGATWMQQYGDDETSDLVVSGVNRIVCIAPNTLFAATDRGLYLSIDGGRNFGSNEMAFDDATAIFNADPALTGMFVGTEQFISALIADVAATTLLRVEDADGMPTRITCTNHGFKKDDRVYIGGVAPAVTANGSWLVDDPDDSHFTLRNSLGTGGHATQGWVMGPARPRTLTVTGATTPTGGKAIVVTSASHEFVTGDVVAVHGVRGARGVNGVWTITVLDDDRFELDASHGTGAYQAGTGEIDAAPRRARFAVTAADNTASGIDITAPGHTLRSGDTVRITGLPGVTGGDRQRRVQLVTGQPDKIRLAGKKMNAPYAGGGFAEAPAVWNHILYAVANSANDPVGGLLRLTLTSHGLVRSRDLLRGAPGVPSSFGRVIVAQSMLPRADAKLPDGRTLFCAVQSGGGKKGLLRALLISSDHGRTWTSRKSNIDPRLINKEAGQSEYDFTVGVDPLDPRRVYIALKQVFTSADGGVTWPVASPITGGGTDVASLTTFARTASSFQLHWDHHELVFAPPTHWDWTTAAPAVPKTPAPVFFGTDGGIARSDDAGASYVTLNDTIASNLLVGFDIGRGAGVRASYGGMQDTGVAGLRAVDASRHWIGGTNGDGNATAVDPADADSVFSITNGGLVMTRDGGATWVRAGSKMVTRVLKIENLNPGDARVHCFRHSFRTGEKVQIVGAKGAGGVANGTFTVTVEDARRFRLNGFHPAALPATEAGPLARGPRYPRALRIVGASLAKPVLITTDVPHGFSPTDRVHVEGIVGPTQANNTDANPAWPIAVAGPTSFTLTGSDASAVGIPTYEEGTGRVHGPRTTEEVPIVFATNPTAAQVAASGHGLVVTAPEHGFASGDTVDIENVRGNTAANGAGRTIRVIDENSFELVGIAGSSPFLGGIGAGGATFGAGLPTPDPDKSQFVRVALVPNGASPAQRVYFAFDKKLFRSDDGGFKFKKVATFLAELTAIASPANDRLWVGIRSRTSGSTPLAGEVNFSSDGGEHWRKASDGFDRTPGGRTSVAAIAIDGAVASGDRVAVGFSGYSVTDPLFRTRHVYLTENGGRAWREIGGTRLAPTGNVPDLPVLSLAFDSRTSPSTLYAAFDAGVLRWIENTNTWQRVGANLANVSCQSVQLDPSANPTVIRIGTYGRSAFELTRSAAAKLVVRGNLAFKPTVVAGTRTVEFVVHNAGGATLSVSDIKINIGGGPTDFKLAPGTVTAFELAAGDAKSITVVFTPTATGRRGDEVEVLSDAGHATLRCTGDGVAAAGRVRVGITQSLAFGRTPAGTTLELVAKIENIGFMPASIGTIQIQPGGSPAFTIANMPALPHPLQPGETADVTVRFAPAPGAKGAVAATLQFGEGPAATPNFTRDCNLSGTATNNAADLFAIILSAFGLGGEPALAD